MEPIIQILTERNSLNVTEVQMLQLTFQLLLMLPVITTIIGVCRYIIGLKTISVYAPIILTFSFFEFGLQSDSTNIYHTDTLQGIKFGVAIFFIVFVVTVLMFKLLKRLRMHYVPKTTLILTGVSLSLILAIFIGTFIFERKGLIYLDVIVVLMIASLGENLVSLLARKNIRSVIEIVVQTLMISIFSYLIIVSEPVKNLVLYNAGILLIIIVLINLYLGKFWGLRLSEYWRFRDIIFAETQESGKSNNSKKK